MSAWRVVLQLLGVASIVVQFKSCGSTAQGKPLSVNVPLQAVAELVNTVATEGHVIKIVEECRHTRSSAACTEAHALIPAVPATVKAAPKSDEAFLKCLHKIAGSDAGYDESVEAAERCGAAGE